jgi:hypothetical protein
VSKVARNEMHRLHKIEEDYPIKIEQYLTTEVNSLLLICVRLYVIIIEIY